MAIPDVDGWTSPLKSASQLVVGHPPLEGVESRCLVNFQAPRSAEDDQEPVVGESFRGLDGGSDGPKLNSFTALFKANCKWNSNKKWYRKPQLKAKCLANPHDLKTEASNPRTLNQHDITKEKLQDE